MYVITSYYSNENSLRIQTVLLIAIIVRDRKLHTS